MAKRTTLRLGFGDVLPPAAPSFRAQHAYLEAVWAQAPKVIKRFAEIARTPVTDGPPRPIEPAVWAACDAAHLADRWVRHALQQHVTHWREHPGEIGQLRRFTASQWEPEWPPAPSWDPIAQTERAYLATIRRYIVEIKARPDYRPAPVLRVGALHFTWLALYQVRAWSIEKLAREVSERRARGITPQAVSLAIHAAAKHAGITLRAAQGRSSS